MKFMVSFTIIFNLCKTGFGSIPWQRDTPGSEWLAFRVSCCARRISCQSGKVLNIWFEIYKSSFILVFTLIRNHYILYTIIFAYKVISGRMLGVTEDYIPIVHLYGWINVDGQDASSNSQQSQQPRLLNRELVDRGVAQWTEHIIASTWELFQFW